LGRGIARNKVFDFTSLWLVDMPLDGANIATIHMDADRSLVIIGVADNMNVPNIGAHCFDITRLKRSFWPIFQELACAIDLEALPGNNSSANTPIE